VVNTGLDHGELVWCPCWRLIRETRAIDTRPCAAGVRGREARDVTAHERQPRPRQGASRVLGCPWPGGPGSAGVTCSASPHIKHRTARYGLLLAGAPAHTGRVPSRQALIAASSYSTGDRTITAGVQTADASRAGAGAGGGAVPTSTKEPGPERAAPHSTPLHSLTQPKLTAAYEHRQSFSRWPWPSPRFRPPRSSSSCCSSRPRRGSRPPTPLQVRTEYYVT